MKLTLDSRELASSTLSPDTLAVAIEAVEVNGYVILENALPRDYVEDLRSAYMALFEAYLEDPAPTSAKNHYRVDLPFRQPFSDALVVDNPVAMPIIEALIGTDCVCRYFASNTCTPGSEYQAVHSDIYPLFPATQVVPPAYMVVLNIPLVDTTEENGPIEIWPGGTHLRTIAADEMKKLAAHMHSEPVVMPAGSILIRDGRMWHRGTLNRSDQPRPNIALAYSRPWMVAPTRRIGIPQKRYEALSDRAQGYFRLEAIGESVDCELL